MWCLSGRNRTPNDAARAHVARGEFKVGKTQGNQDVRGIRNAMEKPIALGPTMRVGWRQT